MATPRLRLRPSWSPFTGMLAAFLLFPLGLLLLAPLLFGPALSALVRAGAEVEHRCACGMVPGACGCTACDRVERERREALAARAHGTCAFVRTGCDVEGMPALGSLAPCLEPAAVVAVVRPPAFTLVRDALPRARSRVPDEPPMPPPKALFAV